MEFDLLIFGVLTTGAVLIVGHLARLVRTAILHRTIREAISRDVDALPALMQSLEPKTAPAGDDRTGLVLIAIALATICFGFIHGDAERFRSMAGVAFYPGLVGLALLGRHLWVRRGDRN